MSNFVGCKHRVGWLVKCNGWVLPIIKVNWGNRTNGCLHKYGNLTTSMDERQSGRVWYWFITVCRSDHVIICKLSCGVSIMSDHAFFTVQCPVPTELYAKKLKFILFFLHGFKQTFGFVCLPVFYWLTVVLLVFQTLNWFIDNQIQYQSNKPTVAKASDEWKKQKQHIHLHQTG